MDEAIWNVTVTLAEVPDLGLHVELEAPAPVRAKLTELAGLRAMTRFSAVFDVKRRGAGLHVAGRVDATVGQTCVVTLEPVENAVDEEIDLLFQPGAPAAPASGDHRAEPEKEAPEPLVGDTIDLGAIASEFLMLGIDPYPRKAGAEFSTGPVEPAGEHPFAALAALKKGPDGSRS